MARREYTLRKQCAHEGCKEIGRWTFDTRKELASSYPSKHEFRCVRHSKPGEVLSTENLCVEKVMTSSRGACEQLYWDGSSGFVFGQGFRAWAGDFPEGTRLIISARVELPVLRAVDVEQEQQP